MEKKHGKSVESLKGFLATDYMDNPEMGSGDMPTAIRDLLTDILHLGNQIGVNINDRLADAQEVYEEECAEDETLA